MDHLSLKKYGWRCVLGAEVTYLICLLGAFFPVRTDRARELHQTLFELLPGFIWGDVSSFFLGGIYMFLFAWIFAGYYVWMHNSSMEKRR